MPIIFDKLPYMLYTSTKLVIPWKCPGNVAKTCRSCA